MANEDGAISGTEKPAKLGSIVTVYACGLGATDPAGEDGKVADASSKRPIHAVKVTVGDQDVETFYTGTAPGIVEGVAQINFRLPKTLPGVGGCCGQIYLGASEMVPQPKLLFYFV